MIAEDYFNVGIIASNILIGKGAHKMGLSKEVFKQMQEDLAERVKNILQRKLNEEMNKNGKIVTDNLSRIEKDAIAEVS